MNTSVKVTGLREMTAAFKRIDSTLPGALKIEFKGIAETVAGRISSKVPRKSGRAAGSVKARASTRGASIAVGGTKAPHYPWLDFGGRVGRGDSISRTFIKEGRYLYPTIGEMSDDIGEATLDAVERVARNAGFETRGF